MFELVAAVTVVVIGAVVWLKWSGRKKVAQGLAEAADGEYLNWAKAERCLKNKNYSLGDEPPPENMIQEEPGVYATGSTAGQSSKKDSPRRLVVDEINKRFVEKRLVEAKDLFDELELSEAQRLAVVRDEDANLINAGAGSGKTRTILAKVRYLIERGLADPAEVLIVTYNTKISGEIKQKVKSISPDITVSTFHAFGRNIIKKVEKHSPDLSPLALGDGNLNKFLSEKVKGVLKDQRAFTTLTQFFSTHRFFGDPEKGIKTKDEYYRKISVIGLRSLNGVQLKSHQEVQIANWLTLNGINWDYEFDYPYIEDKKRYKPDFYLPDYDIWIEHFGIDRDGKTAPWIDRIKYNEGIKWKLETHLKNETRLVDTYSYEAKEAGGLPRALEEKLTWRGVKKTPLSDKDIDSIVEQSFKPTSNFITLLKTFLMLAREIRMSGGAIESRAKSTRDLVFLALFNLFLGSYEKKLKDENTIDYPEMIVRGMEYVKRGKYQSRFKYILVDEYQDITKARLDLLLSLQQQVEDARLFCVGDDWQSINQFQGANVDLIADFESYVGAVERTDLDKTFRYSQKVNDFSRLFITQNPKQLNKKVSSVIPSAENARPIRIMYHTPAEQARKLMTIIDLIARQASGVKTCFVLGRYKHDCPGEWEEIKQHAKSKDIKLLFSTIHKSKGGEADWVIVLENKLDADGRYGFPSGIEDDTVLQMVRPKTDMFRNAEERRLFYVAITRTKQGVFLLVPTGEASEFINEITSPAQNAESEYAPFILVEEDDTAKRLLCPECGGRTVYKKPTKDGNYFYGCSHYPLCSGTLPTCANEDCDAVVDLEGLEAVAVHQCECGQVSEICPTCRSGILLQREWQDRIFWGCSQFRATDCRYTQNTAPKQNQVSSSATNVIPKSKQ